MGLHELSGHKFSTLQDIVFFLCPMIYPSYMPEKCQGLLEVRRKRAVAVRIQLAESEDPQPALWVRNAFWLCWSADQSHIKRQWKLILLLKYYAIGYCHWGDFSPHSSLSDTWLSWSRLYLKGLFDLTLTFFNVSLIKMCYLSKWLANSSNVCSAFLHLSHFY